MKARKEAVIQGWDENKRDWLPKEPIDAFNVIPRPQQQEITDAGDKIVQIADEDESCCVTPGQARESTSGAT